MSRETVSTSVPTTMGRGAGRGVREGLIGQVVRENPQCTCVDENAERAGRLGGPAGMHRDDCGTPLDTFGELFCIVTLLRAP